MTETVARSAHDVERRKRERYATLVLVELPRLRCLGFVFLSLGVYLNNRFLLGERSLHDWTVITIVMAIFAGAAWAVQALFFKKFAIDLTVFFLVADMVVCSATPQHALVKEWAEHGIHGHVAAICGQEVGGKQEILERTGAQDIASTGEAKADYGKSDKPRDREVA